MSLQCVSGELKFFAGILAIVVACFYILYSSSSYLLVVFPSFVMYVFLLSFQAEETVLVRCQRVTKY